jgi:hypothetical protein
MKKQISELSGVALDWAVAKCEGYETIIDKGRVFCTSGKYGVFVPATTWSQGGPIIEREEITIMPSNNQWAAIGEINAKWDCGKLWFIGKTTLEAAMRCYVASKLGYEVDIPDELC